MHPPSFAALFLAAVGKGGGGDLTALDETAVRKAERDDDILRLRIEGKIGEIERLQQRLDAAEARRRENEGIMLRMWRISSDLLCTVGPDARYLKVSPSWRRWLDYAEEDLVGHYWGEFVHPADIAEATAAWQLILTGTDLDRFFCRMRHRNGSWVWVAWNASLCPVQRYVYAVGRTMIPEDPRIQTLEAQRGR